MGALRWARHAIGYAEGTGQADLWPAALAHLGLASALATRETWQRPSVRPRTGNSCDGRRSRPALTLTVGPAGPPQSLIEEPSDGELAAPHCLASDLSQREIGGQLYLSVNTVNLPACEHP